MVSMPDLRRARRPFVVHLDHQERNVRRPQLRADELPDAAMADQDDVIRQGGGGARFGVGCHPRGLVRCGRRGGLGTGEPAVEDREQERVHEDRQDRAGQDEVAAPLRQDGEVHAQPGQDERELADLRQARGDGEDRRLGMPEQPHDGQRRQRLADDDDQERGHDGAELPEDDRRVEEHADRHEEQDRERVPQGQGFGGGPVTELRLAHHHAGEEGSEGEGHAEQQGGPIGDTEGDGEDRQAEELPRSRMGDVMQDPGDQPATDDEHQGHEGHDLAEGDGERLEKGQGIGRARSS